MFFLFSVLGLAIVSWRGRLGLGARDARYEGQVLAVARFFFKNFSLQPPASAPDEQLIIFSELMNFSLSAQLRQLRFFSLSPAQQLRFFSLSPGPGEREFFLCAGPGGRLGFLFSRGPRSPARGGARGQNSPRGHFFRFLCNPPPGGPKRAPGAPAGRLINGFSGDFTHQRIFSDSRLLQRF